MVEFKIPVQPVDKRVRNFSEVVIGLNKQKAIEQAKLYLQKEVVEQGEGCPLGTDLFGFVRYLADGDIQGAFNIIIQKNPFPAITGRLFAEPVDPLQVFDKSGELVSIRMLERFVGDQADVKKLKNIPKLDASRIAVIGSGPAGLTAAVQLARKGFQVTIFEALHKPGGVWRYGYPAFRLPPAVVDRQIEFVKAQGVEFQLHVLFGTSLSLDHLMSQGFNFVLLATGAGLSKSVNIGGKNFAGVISGDAFLQKINLSQRNNAKARAQLIVGKKIVILGDDNTAFDCARVCVRLGADVTLVSKGTQDDFKVRKYIAQHAHEEGITFEVLTNIVKILGDNRKCVRGLHCRRFDYIDQNNTGRWTLTQEDDSDFEIQADTVIVATGNAPNGLFGKYDERWRFKNDYCIWTKKKSLMTSVDNVFACGNLVDGPGPLVSAMLSAKKGAEEIEENIKANV